ncbi:MAG: thioesterase II family protein [Caldilineales bacterium]|nr:thioesterase II family protein [Caldilineales bacterium]MDW8319054.1 thioesterase II family protein [Anaerolineae bacterium]
MSSNPWLSCPKPNPVATVRLFCFPYSGAAASVYYPWADLLPPNIEVCPVQLPGHGTRLREPLATRLAPQVEALAAGLAPAFDRPFAFFGHSMGALLSFELARYLRRTGRPGPVHLFVSGHGAPHLPDRNPPLHALPDDQFVAKLRELNGTPEEVLRHQELLQLLIPVLRADFAVCETYVYQPEPPLACPISAYGGLGDGYVNREELAAWREQTTGPFALRMFPGDHFYLNSPANRTHLLMALARELLKL